MAKKSRAPGGLTDWFKEKWVDVKTGKPCGRKKSEKKEKGILLVDLLNEFQVKHLKHFQN